MVILCGILHNKGGVCKEYYCAIKPRNETISCKGQQTNDRDAQTDKENNQRSQPTQGGQNNADTERSIMQINEKETETENRQREQPLWRQGASGRHVWDTL